MRARRIASLAVVAGLTASLAVAASPARASSADHCLEPPYTESVPYCACITVSPIANAIVPDLIACFKP